MSEQQPSTPEWEEPEIVDVSALDDALGTCNTGKTQAGGCRSGNGNSGGCRTGYSPSGTNRCSNGSGVSSPCFTGYNRN